MPRELVVSQLALGLHLVAVVAIHVAVEDLDGPCVDAAVAFGVDPLVLSACHHHGVDVVPGALK